MGFDVVIVVLRMSSNKKIIRDLIRKGLNKGEGLQVILERIFGGKVDVDFDVKDISYLRGVLRYRTDERTHRSNLVGVIVLNVLVFLLVLVGLVSSIPMMMAIGFFDLWFVYQLILLPVVLFFPVVFFVFLFSISVYNVRKYRWFIYFVGLSLVADVVRFAPTLDGITMLEMFYMALKVVILLLSIKLYVSMRKRFEVIDDESVDENGVLRKRRILRVKE